MNSNERTKIFEKLFDNKQSLTSIFPKIYQNDEQLLCLNRLLFNFNEIYSIVKRDNRTRISTRLT